ncbi:diguanylate cyclase domain-containing protein [Catenovulum sp. SX2]|uniref:GGDEF domain-containing response regulator n=1 Tax=Catenovulum sp. SX2 TaxID=3398614 RepID=UPI003F87137B
MTNTNLTTLAPSECTVLIIDDDTVMLQTMARALKDDYKVKIATDGLAGLNIIEADANIDLIILDIIMPGLKGFDVCKRIKSNPNLHKIPIIFVTALSDLPDKTQAFNLGAVDFVTKPIELPVLKARVRTHVMLKRQFDHMEQMATTDPLTQIANRRKYDDMLALEWKRAIRNQTSIALLILDIDNFKNFNDHYGHGAGDDCLTIFARLLKRCANRPTDLAARLGGEEFAVILADSDKNGATTVADRILEQLHTLHMEHKHSDCATFVTCSIGIAVMAPDFETQANLIYDQADEALYKAKHSGKNRYVAY